MRNFLHFTEKIMVQNTRTASASTLSETGQTFAEVFAGGDAVRVGKYSFGVFSNQGEEDVYIASLGENGVAPVAGDYIKIVAGDYEPVGDFSTTRLYIKTANDGGTNLLKFNGKPA